jgi:hypothetical protein
VTHLRFRPHEYRVIARACRSLCLAQHPLPAFRRLLLGALSGTAPEVAARVACLCRQRLQLLYNHLRRPPPALRPHGLTAEEVRAVAEVRIPLLSQARFIHLLKRALVRRLEERQRELAQKLQRLSLRQFGALCEEVNERARTGD